MCCFRGKNGSNIFQFLKIYNSFLAETEVKSIELTVSVGDEHDDEATEAKGTKGFVHELTVIG